MPSGLTVEYPAGQSLDENGVVQLDGDWRLEGGVAPDIRVPLTMDTVRAQFKGGRDVVLETAVRILSETPRQNREALRGLLGGESEPGIYRRYSATIREVCNAIAESFAIALNTPIQQR